MAVQPQKIVRSSACEGGDYLKAVSSYGGRSEEQRASVEGSEKTEPWAHRPLGIACQLVVRPRGIFSGGAPLIRVFKERPHEPARYLDGDKSSQPRRCHLLGLGSHSEHGELPMTLRLRTQPRLLRSPPLAVRPRAGEAERCGEGPKARARNPKSKSNPINVRYERRDTSLTRRE